eukprot:COSAG04_NODE_9250_length_882_cov_2.436782_1_plen_149_part_10
MSQPALSLDEQISSTDRILGDIAAGKIGSDGGWSADSSGYGKAGEAAAAAATIRSSSALSQDPAVAEMLAMMDELSFNRAGEAAGSQTDEAWDMAFAVGLRAMLRDCLQTAESKLRKQKVAKIYAWWKSQNQRRPAGAFAPAASASAAS